MNIRKAVFIISLFIFSGSLSYGQSWNWGQVEYAPIATTAVATDKGGNAYIAGYYTTQIIFGTDTLKTNNGGTYFNDGSTYLVKYNPVGNVIWAVQPTDSTNSTSWGISVATDKFGNVFITGMFEGTVAFGAIPLRANNAVATFLVKYSPLGNVIWAKQSTPIGRNSDFLQAYSVASDGMGNAFITGIFTDTISFGAYSLISQNIFGTVFLTKYDSSGNVLWAKQAVESPDTSSGYGYSVATDNMGNAYITGFFLDTLSFGSYTLFSPFDATFIAKYSASGNILWAKQSSYDGISDGTSYSVITDKANNSYITGEFADTIKFGSCILYSSPTWPLNGGIFLTKYDSNGNVIWAKQSSPGWRGVTLTSDTLNHIYLGGMDVNISYNKELDTLKFGAYKLYTSPWLRVASFIMEFDTSGNPICGSMLDNLDDLASDFEDGIASDASGTYVYITGVFNDTIQYANDTLIPPPSERSIFTGRWKPCCGNITLKVSPNTTICSGNNVTLTASGATTYSWSPSTGLSGTTGASIIAAPTSDITYKVTGTSQECNVMDSVIVNVNSPPVVNLCCDSSIIYGQKVQLISSGGGSYSWSPNIALSCDTCPNPVVTPPQTTTYTLTVTNDSGCVATKFVTIDVSCGNIFIPNAFSPGAGYNNILYVRGPCIQNLEFDVFDRWGNKIFESTSPTIGWDGNHNGAPMNMGTYMYYARATMYDGSIVEKHGDVTLVR